MMLWCQRLSVTPAHESGSSKQHSWSCHCGSKLRPLCAVSVRETCPIFLNVVSYMVSLQNASGMPLFFVVAMLIA